MISLVELLMFAIRGLGNFSPPALVIRPQPAPLIQPEVAAFSTLAAGTFA